MQKFIYLLLVIFLYSISLLAQNYGTLRGNISDSLSGEALPYSNVLLEGTTLGASADLNGNFTIPGIPAKKYKLRISFVGYNTKFLDVTVKPNEIIQLKIELSSSNVQLQAIEFIGEKVSQPNETNLGLQKVDIRDIELLPKGVETDIFRSLQFLPGVQSTGDVSARYYVRGGGSNQNLVLLNGVSVYNPFHALGLFSIIDPEMINAIEFYKGGFSADYGGRLSSVLNLITKDGNKNRYSGSASLSFLTAKGLVEGPIPGGSFMVTFRKSLFNDVLKKFINFKDAPFEFYDFSGKANYFSSDAASLTKISLHGFNSRDQLLNEDSEKADYKWTNSILGGNWFQAWENVPIYSEASISLSKFSGEILPKLSNAKTRINSVNDVTLKTDFAYIYDSRDELHIGYELKSIKTDLNFENQQGTKSTINDNGLGFTLYGKYKFLRYEDFGVDIGSRINGLTLSNQKLSIVEPRINFSYQLLPGFILKGAWGIYTQQLITLSDENEIISIFEPWLIVPDYLQVPEAIHYVAGLELSRIERLSIKSEFYYKLLRRTAEINHLKASDQEPDFVTGSGQSYGGELLVQYSAGSLNGSASYSLSWTYKELFGWVSNPKYDVRHSVTTNINYDFGDGWIASASWFFNSGLPFTQILGYYDKLYFENLFFSSGLYGVYNPFTVLSDPNLGRLPTYHRLDLSLSKKLKVYFADILLSFDVMNVYDRKNIFYFERDTGKRVNMLPILPTASIKVEL
ncbi:MAG: TonB-dependent receptor [Ignavibacteriales bacterium]|nr:MAG: TonB-dependent receptor [Ignavibacteriales bacterium]